MVGDADTDISHEMSSDDASGDQNTRSPSGFSAPKSDTADDTEQTAPVPSFPGMGDLLENPDLAAVARAMVKLVQDQAPARRRRRAETKCNELWLRGIRGARVKPRSEDRDDVELTVPLGAFNQPPIMDRADELLEKLISHLLADPPMPDAEPSGDNDADRDAAEFTTRLLTVEGAESGFNNLGLLRRAGRKSGVAGSGFISFFVDPMGGGWRPMEIRAHPQATTVQNATTDPLTGSDADEETLTTRYVTATDTLTDVPSEAQEQWVPKIRTEVGTGENVVMLPATCRGINDANGEVLIRWTELGELKAMFPDTVGTMSDEQLRTLVDWKIDEAKRAKPGFLSSKDISASGTDESGKITDSALVCTLSLYYKSHGSYKKGAYIVAGGDTVLHRALHVGMVQGPKDGDLIEECLELPTSQVRQLDDDIFDDPYGRGLVAKIGPADEVRGQVILSLLDYIERFAHPHWFLPIGSVIQPDQLSIRDDTPILYNPQGKPEQEVIPAFPPDLKEFADRASTAQDSALGLGETASGLEVPTVTSGKQADSIIQQSHVNLTGIMANMADAQERAWRIVTQLMRVYFTIPCKMKYVGDDGAYKEREWTRADLGSTRNIRIARGSFTQQNRIQKQSMLDQRLQAQLIDRQEYDRLSGANLSATIGTQDNPHLLRVRRQISTWRENPQQKAFEQAVVQKQQGLKAYQAAVAQHQALQSPVAPAPAVQVPGAQVPGAPPVAPTPAPAAPPIPPPQPPPDPTLRFNPFADHRPVDDEPDVSALRHLELRREVAGTAYRRATAEWRQFLTDEYLVSRKNANILSIPQQQQAKQGAAGTPDATFAEFRQDVDTQVVKLTATSLAKQIAAMSGAIPPSPSNSPASPSQPGPSTVNPIEKIQAEHNSKAALQTQKETAQANESEAQRSFEREQAMSDHEAELTKLALSGQGAPLSNVPPAGKIPALTP